MDISISPDRVLDMGDIACGQLLMEVMQAMRELTPGQTILVLATDPAAPVDLGAWCRMSGNTLVSTDASEKQFLIRKGQ